MSFADPYFRKHSFLIPDIEEPPEGLLFFVVVIPVYLEEELVPVLESLKYAAQSINTGIEIILLFNHPESDSDNNKKVNAEHYRRIQDWCKNNTLSGCRFYPLWVPDLPQKQAGAGLARKIGMDVALSRFNRIERPEGIILSLDADTIVETNYFTAIREVMLKEEKAGGCILNFAHPIEGTEFSPEVYSAIIQYELHLRYYKNMLHRTGFPWARYTIGSCFGVRAGVYAWQGGMNRQKAGEDFYFLNKLFPHYAFPEIRSTTVHPSPRLSDRVPFGTGPVMQRMLTEDIVVYKTYAPEAFCELGKLFARWNRFINASEPQIWDACRDIGPSMNLFLRENNFAEKIREISKNTASAETFRKRFFLWFDAFRVVKYLNFAHQHEYSRVPVEKAVVSLFEGKKISGGNTSAKKMLERLRKRDKGLEM